MGGEGSMSYANQSLRYNRGQLGKRKFRDIKDLLRAESGKTLIEFEKIEPSELEMIKKKIRLKARKEQKKMILVYMISTFITGAILLVIFL